VQAAGTCSLQRFLSHQVVQRADARGAKAQRLVSLFGQCNKLFQRVHRQILAHNNRNRRVPHQGGQAHVFRFVFGRGHTQRGVDQFQRRARQNGVAIGLGIRCLEHPQRATHAHHVFHDDGLAKHFSHAFADGASQHIRATARWKGHDHADGFGRIRLRGNRSCQRKANKQCTAVTNQSAGGWVHGGLQEKGDESGNRANVGGENNVSNDLFF
jgi:hypothetical protein